MTNAWHNHPSRHRLGKGGSLGFPESPKLAFPGTSFRRGASGIPAASDHNHPLEAIRMQVFSKPAAGASGTNSSSFSNWGTPFFDISFEIKDPTCGVAFQYLTSFWVDQSPAGVNYGMYDATLGLVKAGTQSHYKNVVADHTFAGGVIVYPPRFEADGVTLHDSTGIPKGTHTFRLQWRRYTGVGVARTDNNDSCQIIAMEYYLPV